MKQSNFIKIFICAVFTIIGALSSSRLTAWVVISSIPIEDVPYVEFLGHHPNESLLCGVNCAVAVENLFGTKDMSYWTIAAEFPEVEKCGISLAQLEKFFQKRNYHCKIVKISAEKLSEFTNATAAIILQRSENINHLIVKYNSGDGKILTIDIPQKPKLEDGMSSDSATQKHVMLLVSKQRIGFFVGAEPMDFLKFLFPVLFLIILFFTIRHFAKTKFQDFRELFKKKTILTTMLLLLYSAFLFVISAAFSSLPLAAAEEKKEEVVAGAATGNSSKSVWKKHGIFLCDDPIFDAGEMDYDKENKVYHRFHLKNDSTEEVELKKVEASCSCTNVTASTDKIKPGEKFHIDATVSLGAADFKGVLSQILVQTNKGVIPLKFIVRSKHNAYVTPNETRFEGLAYYSTSTARIFVGAPSYEKMEQFVEKIEFSPSAKITAKVHSQKAREFRDSKGKMFYHYIATVDLTLDVPRELGVGETTAIFRLKNGAEVSTKLRWDVPAGEVFTPSAFDVTRGGEKETFQIAYNELLGGKIKRITPADASLKILETVSVGNITNLTIEMNFAEVKEASSERFLTVETEDGKIHKFPIHILDPKK